MKKLIVTDIDGTLVREDKTISKETKERLMSLQENGNVVVVATGRIHGAGRIVAHELGWDNFLISCNGAVVRNMLTDEILYEKIVPTETAVKVVELYKSIGIYFHVYTDVGLFSEFNERLAPYYASLQPKLSENLRFTVEVVDDILPIVSTQKVHKIGAWSDDPKVMELIRSKLEGLEGIVAYKSHDRLFDVMCKGSNKTAGIKALLDYYGINIDNLYTFGDNDNDADMIEMSPHGVAMGNGSEKARQAAKFVTLSNDEDGLLHALNHFGLE